MLRHKSTGIVFQSRKQARQLVGGPRYNWLRKIDQWEFLNDEEEDSQEKR